MKLKEEIAQAWHRLDTDGGDWGKVRETVKAGYRTRASMLVESVPRLKELAEWEMVPSVPPEGPDVIIDKGYPALPKEG